MIPFLACEPGPAEIRLTFESVPGLTSPLPRVETMEK